MAKNIIFMHVFLRRHLHHRTARVPVIGNSTAAAEVEENGAMYEVGGNNATDSIAVASYPQYKENISHFIRVGDTLVRNCSSPFDNIDFENPRIVGSLVPLGIVCLIGPVIDAH